MGFGAARSCIQIVALKRPSARSARSTWPKSKKWNLNCMQNTKAHTHTHTTTHTHTHRHHVDNVLSIAFGHFCFLCFFLSVFAICPATFWPKNKNAKRTKCQKFSLIFLWLVLAFLCECVCLVCVCVANKTNSIFHLYFLPFGYYFWPNIWPQNDIMPP